MFNEPAQLSATSSCVGVQSGILYGLPALNFHNIAYRSGGSSQQFGAGINYFSFNGFKQLAYSASSGLRISSKYTVGLHSQVVHQIFQNQHQAQFLGKFSAVYQSEPWYVGIQIGLDQFNGSTLLFLSPNVAYVQEHYSVLMQVSGNQENVRLRIGLMVPLTAKIRVGAGTDLYLKTISSGVNIAMNRLDIQFTNVYSLQLGSTQSIQVNFYVENR